MSFSKFETLAANLSETVEKIEAAKRAAAEQMKQEVVPLFAALFGAIHTLKSVTWAQYTPYFADGDECVFSADESEFVIDLNPDSDLYRDGGGPKDTFDSHVVRYTDEGKFELSTIEGSCTEKGNPASCWVFCGQISVDF